LEHSIYVIISRAQARFHSLIKKIDTYKE